MIDRLLIWLTLLKLIYSYDVFQDYYYAPPMEILLSDQSSFNNHKSIMIHSTNHHSVNCFIPEINSNIPTTNSHDLSLKARVTGIKDALDSLKGLQNEECLTYESSDWVYTYCHNSFVKQEFLVESFDLDGLTEEEIKRFTSTQYILGYYTESLSTDNPLFDTKQPSGSYFAPASDGSFKLRQVWGKGTTCGSTGKPRQIIVNFSCGRGEFIANLYEYSVCYYTMHIKTFRLCHIPYFLPPKPTTSNEIRCNIIKPQELTNNPFKESLKSNPLVPLFGFGDCKDRVKCSFPKFLSKYPTIEDLNWKGPNPLKKNDIIKHDIKKNSFQIDFDNFNWKDAIHQLKETIKVIVLDDDNDD
ncbi:Protein OS-9 [Globomyces sp. JEL0801]|nr:Protein OS-9 [Globomyces sp. JEL0801]